MALRRNLFHFFPKTVLRSRSQLREHEVWVEDIFGSSERRPLVRTLSVSRLTILFILAAVVFGIIFLRIAHLQIVRGSELLAVAEGNRIRDIVIPARRGEIYDRNNIALAKNIPREQVSIIPGDLPKDEADRRLLTNRLSEMIRIPSDELFQNMERIRQEHAGSYDPYALIDAIDHLDALKLSQEIDQFPGIRVEQASLRQYPLGEAVSHAVGYLGKIIASEWEKIPHLPIERGYQKSDFIGKAGLEVSYEDQLRGSHGSRQIEVDSLGREQKVLAEISPVSGNDLVTSLDAGLQKKTYESLLKNIQRVKAKAGSAVAIDPRNGEILAIVSIPSYDNNVFVGQPDAKKIQGILTHPDRPLVFRAISGIYPSGSTIKPLMSSAALAEGVITSRTTIMSTGGIRIGTFYFPDWKAGGHGTTDVKKAISESVNTFFYMIGGGYDKFRGLGVTLIGTYMKMFGLGSRLGIDLPSESAGLVPDPSWKRTAKGERWFIGDTYHLSIGQGDLLVTPLQIASTTATIANGGTVFTPHLLKGYLDARTNKLNEAEVPSSRKIDIASGDLQTVRDGMRQTVTSGSGRALAGEPFEVAGKTGTAEAPSGKTHAWFTSFAPASKPEISVTVMIENGGEGHDAALPVARDMLEEYFRNKK